MSSALATGRRAFGVLAILISLLAGGCDSNEPGEEEDGPLGRVKLDLGVEFTYAWSHEFRDDAGTLLTSELDTFVVRVASVIDAVNGSTGLIRLELYEKSGGAPISASWYRQDQTGLFQLGTYLPTGPTVFPKRDSSVRRLLPFDDVIGHREAAVQDTTWRTEVRKVLAYPLQAGTEWVSFTSPFPQNREVIALDTTTVPAGSFPTVAIRTESPTVAPGIDWVEKIAAEGLIERSIVQPIETFTVTEKLVLLAVEEPEE